MYWPTPLETIARIKFEIRSEKKEMMGDIVKRTLLLSNTETNVSCNTNC